MDYLKDLIRDNKVIDVSRTTIELSNIITESSNDHTKICSAQIQADYFYFEEAARKEGSPSYKGPLQRITYTLKKTDDGKLYAEVQGLN